MKLITITGLDGSGKSTQASKIKEHLEAKGHRVYYFHAVAYSLPNQLKKKLNKSSKSHHDKSVTTAGRLSLGLRRLVLPVDLRRFRRLLKRLEHQGYDVVLSDRFFYDSLVNIAYLAGQSQLPKANLPRPDVAIYLKANPTLIMQRQRQPDQGLDYLEAKAKLFDLAAKIYGLKSIEGNQSEAEVFKAIQAKIEL